MRRRPIDSKAFPLRREGYYFARLHGVYEFLSVAKTYEVQQKDKLHE